MDDITQQDGSECNLPTLEELTQMVATVVHSYFQQHVPPPNPPRPPPIIPKRASSP